MYSYQLNIRGREDYLPNFMKCSTILFFFILIKKIKLNLCNVKFIKSQSNSSMNILHDQHSKIIKNVI